MTGNKRNGMRLNAKTANTYSTNQPLNPQIYQGVPAYLGQFPYQVTNCNRHEWRKVFRDGAAVG